MTFFRSSGGGASLDITDRTNTSGGLLAEGTIVADGAANKSFVACDISDKATAASRPTGVVFGGDVSAAALGTLRTVAGTDAPTLLVTGLLGTAAVGDEVIASATVGRGTLSKAGGTSKPSSSPEAINRIGVITSLLTYDGAGDDLVLVQLDLSARRGV